MKKLFIIFLYLVAIEARSNGSNPPPPPTTMPPPPPPGLETDNGVWIMISLGIILAFYLMYSNKIQKKTL